MNPKLLMLILLQALLNIGGATLIKKELNESTYNNIGEQLLFLFKLKPFIGLALIGVGFLVMISILKEANLSLFQPISSGLTYIVTIGFSIMILQEKISWSTLLGMVVILAGVLLITKSN